MKTSLDTTALTRLWSSACVAGLRFGPLLLALPLCTSVCLFGIRFALSALGMYV